MFRKLALILALTPLLWLSNAYALSLGDIVVQSQLNQRFSAVIPLTLATDEDADNIHVQLASSDDFTQAGIERSDYLGSLTFQVATDGNNPRIVISSEQIAHDPFLTFMLDVRSASGHIVRQYTALLDPPGYSKSAAPAPVSTSSDLSTSAGQPAPSSALPAQSAPVALVDDAAASPALPAAQVEDESPSSPPARKSYGPVKPGETLWSIAAKLRTDPTISMNQVLLAIYNKNRRAFEPRLEVQKGSVLHIPSVEQMRSVSPAEATRRVEELRGQRVMPAERTHHAVHAKEAATKAAAPVAAPEPVNPATESVTEPAAEAKPEPAQVPAVPAAAQETPAPEPSAPQAAVPPASSLPGSVPSENPAPAQLASQSQSPQPVAPASKVTAPVSEIKSLIPHPPTLPAPGSFIDTPMTWAAGVVVLLIGLLVLNFMRRKRIANSEDEPAAESKSGWNPWKKEAVAATAPELRAVKVAAGAVAGTAATAAAEQSRFNDTALQPVATTPVRLPEPERGVQLPDFSFKQNFDAPAKPASLKGISTDTVDFDAAGKSKAETLRMDLEGDDPVSEADFHLAYGLYDESALLLKKAIAREPKRTDLRAKLAETYFRAGKAMEFQETAEPLKDQLSPAEWQKIAIMGQQVNPDSVLFRTTGAAAAHGVMDLTLDEPEVIAAPAAPVVSHPQANEESHALDFRLEDFDVPHVAEPVKAPAAPAAAAHGSDNTLEFHLSDFDLDHDGGRTAKSVVPEVKAPTIDDVHLDNFDLGDLSEDSHAISTGDESSTKLDLARAYVDMGDNETARTLLSEVMGQGSDVQKKDAETLLKRLT